MYAVIFKNAALLRAVSTIFYNLTFFVSLLLCTALMASRWLNHAFNKLHFVTNVYFGLEIKWLMTAVSDDNIK